MHTRTYKQRTAVASAVIVGFATAIAISWLVVTARSIRSTQLSTALSGSELGVSFGQATAQWETLGASARIRQLLKQRLEPPPL